MIAYLLTDDKGELCFADFNSLLKVNRALYACLNRTLWQKAVEFKDITDCVFTHLLLTNDLARLRFFLELDPDVEISLRGIKGDYTVGHWTPLQIAAQLDNLPMARLLLEHGADVVQYDGRRRPSYSAIHAARSGEMVQLLLDHHADPEQRVSNASGNTPLHCYAKRGNIEAMRAILQNGVEVDPIAGFFSYTPLHFAVPHGIDIVKLLVEYGANVKKRDGSLQTPLHLAARAGMTDVVDMLLEHWPGGTRAKDDCKNRPLHLAALSGWTELVRLLVEIWPAGPRKKNNYGYTPLHFAAQRGNTDVVRLLLEHWPEGTRAKDDCKNTPLHLAALSGWTELVRLLVEIWPEGPRKKNNHGYTPLHFAAQRGNTDVVRLLVESWPQSAREKDTKGRTPSQLAARRGKTDVVRLLAQSWPDEGE
jgi:ankyrin